MDIGALFSLLAVFAIVSLFLARPFLTSKSRSGTIFIPKMDEREGNSIADLNQLSQNEEQTLELLISRRRGTQPSKLIGFCPHCGKPVQEDDRYCSRCGMALLNDENR
jgi:hypothetical protein